MVAQLRLRKDQVAKIRRWKNLDTDASLAAAMGVSPANLSRVLNGKQQGGPKFIAALALALDADLDDLFEAYDDELAPGDESE